MPRQWHTTTSSKRLKLNKKNFIGKDDLQEATRKTGREGFRHPDQTLPNAHMLGLLDRGDELGTFCINTVARVNQLTDTSSYLSSCRMKRNRAMVPPHSA
jgi:hypothetical protein